MSVLDRAISETVAEEFNRLKRGRPESEITAQLRKARHQLLGLRNLEMPDYNDEMVAVLYLAAYQLQHINLTYSMIKDMLHRRDPERLAITRTGKLQVVDFGCGALAMHFGLILAVADALEAGKYITSIHIDSIDPSESMLLIGEEMWLKFTDILAQSESERLNWVSKACKLVNHNLYTDIRMINRVENADSWISAIHAVYQANELKVKNNLSDLYRRITPVAGFITCYAKHDDLCHTGNAHIAREVSPFAENDYTLILRSGKDLPNQLGHIGIEGLHITEINRACHLIDDPNKHTRRTAKAVLNWTWDTASFTYTLNGWKSPWTRLVNTPNNTADPIKFTAGEKVRSPSFGDGIVQEVHSVRGSEIILVDFGDAEVKQYLGSKAPLERYQLES